MPQTRTVAAGAINLRTHPHPEGIYPQLITAIYNLRKSVQVHGDRHLLMSALEEKRDGTFAGSIARFTEIDPNLPWFDAETLDEADNLLVRQIEIPENLKPNYVPFSFIFDPHHHTLIFETYSRGQTISPNMMFKYFSNLIETSPELDLGEIIVNLIKDQDRLEDIVGLATLKRLIILLERPNADDLGGLDEEVEDRLRRNNARSIEEKFESIGGESLEPDEETMQLARVAAANGNVVSHGQTLDGTTVDRSLSEHPLIERLTFDPNEMLDFQALKVLANRLIEKIGNHIG